MTFPRDSAYHADSDADDEFERSIMTSPTQAGTDSDTETSSQPRSNQPTPTIFANASEDGGLPTTVITDWTPEECAQFLVSIGLRQYCETCIENAIDGKALVALTHEEFKEMGINSLGHRLTILKKVYDLKVSQDVPIDPDHYVPPSAEQNPQHEMATKEDITRLARSIIKLRDERILQLESQLTRLADNYRKLRLELLPVFKMSKERSEPLPTAPYTSFSTEYPDQVSTPPATAQSVPEKTSLTRTLSTKIRIGGTGPKNASPTHVPSTIHENRTLVDSTGLNPSAAATQASNQLSGAMHQQSPATSTLPSPTSPMPYLQPLAPRIYREAVSASRYESADDAPSRSNPTPTPPPPTYEPPKSASASKTNHSTLWQSNPSTTAPSREQSASVPPQFMRTSERERTNSHNEADAPSVEIFKSFRVALEDPCFKVLPAALRKYNIQADWRQYALYIVYGDQERCVGLEEKPLALFKDLDREGKKPMFMLRKLANPVDVSQMSNTAQGGIQRPLGQSNITAIPSTTSIRSMATSSALPGGVL